MRATAEHGAISRRRLLRGLGAAAATAAGAGAAGPGRASGPALRVEGRRVLLGGVEVPLRGVAVGDALLARAGRGVEDYAVIAGDWHANLARISMHPFLWRGARDRARAALEAEVGAALARGLSVIVEWHAIGWPDGAYEAPHPSRQLPPDAYDTDLALAHDFWAEIAVRLSGEPRVIFEIWNEPARIGSAGRAAPWGEDWRALRPHWAALLATIRRRAGNLVLAAGGSWASDLTGVRDAPLEDEAVGYAWHVYPGTAGGAPERLAELLDELPRARPVFVTEWGFGPALPGHLRGTADGFGAMFATRFLRPYALNWTAWCWQPDWQPPLIEPDWRTPTAAGAFVKGLLAAP